MSRALNPTRLGAAALLALLPLAGCGRAEEPEVAPAADTTDAEPLPDVTVTGVTVGRGIGADFRVIEPTTTFRPLDAVYVSIAIEGVASSAMLGARWTDQEGRVIEESFKSIAPRGVEATEFHRAPPDGWPAGDYEVVIMVENEEVARASFHVVATR